MPFPLSKSNKRLITIKNIPKIVLSPIPETSILTRGRRDITVSVVVTLELKSPREEEVGHELNGVGNLPHVDDVVCGPAVCGEKYSIGVYLL